MAACAPQPPVVDGVRGAVRHQYGDGPNWRLRTIKKALDLLGFNGDLLRHGIKREVFLVPLASNYKEYLLGNDVYPIFYDRDFEKITQYFINRWMIPRSQRFNDWKEWTIKDTQKIIQKKLQLDLQSATNIKI